jgi:endo-1,4-beta-xylanase
MFHRARSLLFLATASVWVLSAGAQTLPQQIAQYLFEDGTADGWTAFYDASAPTYSTAATAAPNPGGAGAESLLTTVNYTSSGGGGGPALNLSSLNLVPGATYTITGYVMLTPGEAASDTNFTIQRQDPSCSGGTCYDTVGTYQVPVTATAWAEIGGSYTVSTTATALLLYAQLSPATTPTTPQSFYLADVTITETAGPPNSGEQDNSGITTNFEDGGLDGWSQRSGANGLSNVAISNGPQGDTNALYVQDRAAYWDGPQISVLNKMYVGSQYSINVWVMSPTGDTLNLSLQTTLTSNGTANTSYTGIATVTAPAGQWVQISVPRFSMSEPYDPNPGSAYLYVQSSSNDTGTNGTPSPTQPFYITDFQLTYLPPLVIQQNIPSIYQTLADYFPVGAEIDSTDLSGPHEQLLVKHFNSIVSGNDMKWQETEPTEGQFTYTVADQEVALAQANKMLVRGHNLVWSTGEQVPSWVFLEADGTTPLSASNPADVQLLTERIQNHIMNLVQHFGTAVYVWDVVNEPLDPTQPDCLEHGPFYQVLGRQYINIALQAARQYAPPGTQLFFNDYSTTDPSRLQCMIRLIRYLQRNQIPLDGVGHEMHNHIDNPSPYSMYWAIATIHRLFPHLHQQVTELDESVYSASDNTSNYGANGGSVPQSIIAEQGWLYKDYFDVFRRLKGRLDAVTFWGMADDDTWLDSFPIDRLDAPLPFDQLLQAKPAYWGIVDQTQLPGYGMTLALTGQSGAPESQTWTITATNPSEATAYNTQINGAFLFQVRGLPCRATVTPPSKYPVALGNVGGGGTASASFTVQFQRCGDDARFVLWAPWSANVYQMGTLVEKNLQP